MSIQVLTHYFMQYGAIFVFVIVLLEYMNLPGFPAGVIMPLAGIWSAKGAISFPMMRTLISIPSGMISMEFGRYTLSSVLGVLIWNTVFIGAGYFFGDAVWSVFA